MAAGTEGIGLVLAALDLPGRARYLHMRNWSVARAVVFNRADQGDDADQDKNQYMQYLF
jgi:hypothetical protein